MKIDLLSCCVYSAIAATTTLWTDSMSHPAKCLCHFVVQKLLRFTSIIVASPWRQLASSGDEALQSIAGGQNEAKVRRRGGHRTGEVLRVTLDSNVVRMVCRGRELCGNNLQAKD